MYVIYYITRKRKGELLQRITLFKIMTSILINILRKI
jgi:hypothetical protein